MMRSVLVSVSQRELTDLNRRVARQHADKRYRPTVGAVLENTRGQILLVQSAGSQTWGFPQGGVKPHEDVVGGLLRELDEEVSITPWMIRKFCFDCPIDIPNMNRGGFTEGKWIYYFHAVCSGTPEVILESREIRAHQWLVPKKVRMAFSTLEIKSEAKKRSMLLALDKALIA